MPPVCGPPHTGGMSMSGDPTLAAVRALEDEFAEAMGRMYTVGNDLARLRARLDREASPQQWTPVPPPAAPQAPLATEAPPLAEAPPVATAAEPPAGPLPVAEPEPALVTAPPVAPAPFAGHQPPPTPPQPTTPWWQRDGVVARLLAVVGTGITLIGVAFLLALAIQMGFFGPVARVTSGVVLAVGLVAAAVVVRRRQASAAGALGLAATGIATAYLDVVAITSIYAWVPAAVGLVIAALVAAGGLLLARAWDSELLAGLTVLGVAVLAPTIAHEHMLLVAQFLLVLTVASWPAQVARRWHVLELVRVAPTALVISVLPLVEESAGAVALLACLLAGFVIVTGLAGARVAAAPASMGLTVPVVALPVLCATGPAAQWAGSALMIGLTVVLVLAATLAASHPKEGAHEVPLFVGCCLATAGATSLISAGLVAEGTDWSLPLLLVVCVLWASAALVVRTRTLTWVALGTAVLPLLISLALVPYALDRGTSPQVDPSHLASAALVVVLLLALADVTESWALLSRTLVSGALLAAGGTVIIAGVLLGALADDPRGGFTAGQTGATVLWLATAAVLLLRGLRGSTVAIPAGLTITALSVGKLLFFDLAFLDGIPRVLSFIVGGLIVLGMGAGYAQALERSRREAEPVDNSDGAARDPHTV